MFAYLLPGGIPRPPKMLAGVVKNTDDSIIKRNGDNRNVQVPEWKPTAAKLAKRGIHLACELEGTTTREFEMKLKAEAISDLAVYRRRAGVTLWTVMRDVELGQRLESLP